MLKARELSAKAELLRDLANKSIDPVFAQSLRQRARECRALAAEVQVWESDPLYRLIHDRPEVMEELSASA